jgi:hypothetical protein
VVLSDPYHSGDRSSSGQGEWTDRMGTSVMTSQQRATWRRIIVVCTVVAGGLVIASLLAREALPILVPIAVVLGAFALLMGLLVRRQS